MKIRRNLFLFGIPLLVMTGYLLWRASGPSNSQIAREGEAAVEAFLREGADGAFKDYGEFQGMSGAGFYTPVWNIQGYDYLGLNRQARFGTSSFRLRIFITGDQKVDRISRPVIEGPVNIKSEVGIKVRHPALFKN